MKKGEMNIHFFDLACYYESILDTYDMTQGELAKIVGVTQSKVANTLRLLALSESVRKIVREGRLSARHARGLLCLSSEDLQMEAALMACEKDLKVGELEALTRKMAASTDKNARKRAFGIFMALLRWGMKLLNERGLDAKAVKRNYDDRLEIVIRIKKDRE